MIESIESFLTQSLRWLSNKVSKVEEEQGLVHGLLGRLDISHVYKVPVSSFSIFISGLQREKAT